MRRTYLPIVLYLFFIPIIVVVVVIKKLCDVESACYICHRTTSFILPIRRRSCPIPSRSIFKGNICQAPTLKEGLSTNRFYTVADDYLRQSIAIIERRTTNRNNTIGDDNTCPRGYGKSNNL